MPKTKRNTAERVGVGLPKPLLEEIDRTVEVFPEHHWNRQQFIETAIRELLLKYRTLEGAKGAKPEKPSDSPAYEIVDLEGRILEINPSASRITGKKKGEMVEILNHISLTSLVSLLNHGSLRISQTNVPKTGAMVEVAIGKVEYQGSAALRVLMRELDPFECKNRSLTLLE